MKNYTRILLLCILLTPFASMAGNGMRNQNNETISSRKIVNGQVNFSNSFSAVYTEDFSGGVPSGWQQIDSQEMEKSGNIQLQELPLAVSLWTQTERLRQMAT